MVVGQAAGTPAPVDAGELRAAIAAAGTRQVRPPQDGVDVAVTVLSVDAHGRLRVGAEGTGVDVEFVLEAVDAGGPGQPWLELDGPLAPVTIRSAGSFSLLMPVRPGPGDRRDRDLTVVVAALKSPSRRSRAADHRDRDVTVLAAAVVSLSWRSPAGAGRACWTVISGIAT